MIGEVIAALIGSKGYALRYVPEACVYNKGVETVHDYFKQRRRIYAGHLALRKRRGYAAATLSGLIIARYLIKDIRSYKRKPQWVLAAIVLEAFTRLLGWGDFMFKREKYAWSVAESTK